jgi:hypothetical protein
MLKKEFQDQTLFFTHKKLLRELKIRISLDDFIDQFKELTYTMKHKDTENCQLFQ